MEGILKKPDTGRYNIADHLSCHEALLVVCAKYAVSMDVPAYMTAGYSSTIATEREIYKWIRRSDYTKKKLDTDHERDLTVGGMTGIVHAHLKDFDPPMRDAALHLNNLLATYGDVTRMDYDAETTAIDSITARLNSTDYQPAVILIGIQPWVTKLVDLNTLFKTYVDDTLGEQLEKPTMTPVASRHATDGMGREFTNRVEALVNINGDKNYLDFAAEFNVIVTHYNTIAAEHYGRLHARIDISLSTIDEIPTQPSTGLPVHVIPVIHLRIIDAEGGEELILLDFSTDYTLAYTNNILPGTATVIAQGIGKYKGEAVTTFNIQ